MTEKTAIIIGATGLVGRQLIQEIANQYSQIICIVRRIPDIASLPATIAFEQLSDFDQLADCIAQLAKRVDLQDADAFSTLGTTLKDAGSKDRFYAIDYGYNDAFASACQQAGCARLFLLSSLGADVSSKTSFYLRTKGKLEDHVASLRYASIYVFRPSLLLGEHAGRTAENIGQQIFGMVKGVIPKHHDYRPIEAERVAQSIALTARHIHNQPDMIEMQRQQNGLYIIDNAAMLKLTS